MTLVRLGKKLYWAVLLKPSKLLRAVRWDDWAWNWMGLKKVLARVFMLAQRHGRPLKAHLFLIDKRLVGLHPP